jgi:hypothetical protein
MAATPPASVVGRGISLTAMVQTARRTTEIQVCMSATANFYNDMIPSLTEEGALVRPCLALIEGLDIAVNTWVAVCNRTIIHPYSIDELVVMQFDVYVVSSVQQDDINLVWAEFIGDALTRLPNESCLSSLVVRRPLRVLTVVPSSSIGGVVRASLLKTAADKAPKEGRGKAREDSFNGKLVYYVDKNRLEDRIVLSRVFRRIVALDMIHLMSNTEGLDYDEDISWNKLIGIGKSMCDRGSITAGNALAGMPSGLAVWQTISHIPAMSSNTAMKRLLAGSWNGVDGTDYAMLSLQNFSNDGLRAGSYTTGDHEFKRRLVVALQYFEQYMCFLCGALYSGVTDRIRDYITAGDGRFSQWLSDYIRYETEHIIFNVFRELLMTDHKTAQETNMGDITCAEGVRLYLGRKLNAITLTDARQSYYLNCAESDIKFAAVKSKQPMMSPPNPNNQSSIPKKVKIQSPHASNQPVVSPKICHYDLMHQLKATDIKGRKYPPCSTHPCKFTHSDIGSLTKTEKKDLVSVRLYGKLLVDALKAIG